MTGALVTKTVSFDELVCAPLLRESRFLSNIDKVRIGEGPPVHVARAEDVLYLPDRRLQIVDDRFVPLEATPYQGALAYVQNASVTDGKGRYEHPIGCREVDEEVCILSNIWSYNLYHWIEELFKATILETYGFKGRYILSGMPDFAAEFLEVLGVSPARIVRDFDKPAVFRSVMLTTPINLMYDVAYYENVFLALRKALLVSVDRSDPAPRFERVWLARGVKALNGRRIVNAEDVDKVLTRFGFQVVDMGTMPARGQIAVSSRARCLGGVHGAAFVHTMFLAECSTVIECFSPEYIHPCMLSVCRHLNHRYFQIVFDNFDKYPYGRDVMIDCAHLELVLRSLETGGGPPDRNNSWGALSRFARTDLVTKVTTISDLPRPPKSSSAANRWDLIEGLNAEVFQGSAVVSGQHILRLVAVGADRRHALGVRFDNLAPSAIHRATAWVKAEPGIHLMIEARDSVDPNTGKPANYGIARFDFAARSVISSNGDILASGVEAAVHDWVKVWVDLRSRDGRIFALIGLLEGSNNRHVFTPANQSVIFGGFDISPSTVVKSP